MAVKQAFASNAGIGALHIAIALPDRRQMVDLAKNHGQGRGGVEKMEPVLGRGCGERLTTLRLE